MWRWVSVDGSVACSGDGVGVEADGPALDSIDCAGVPFVDTKVCDVGGDDVDEEAAVACGESLTGEVVSGAAGSMVGDLNGAD